MGRSGQTICRSGCLISSVAMALNDCGRTINGQIANPRSLNTFLGANGGYSGASLVWATVNRLGLTFEGFTTSKTEMVNKFKAGRAVMLNVNNRAHWVLMTGWTGTNFLVNDPGYNRNSYAPSEVQDSGFYIRPAGCRTLHQSHSFLE